MSEYNLGVDCKVGLQLSRFLISGDTVFEAPLEHHIIALLCKSHLPTERIVQSTLDRKCLILQWKLNFLRKQDSHLA